MPTPRLTEDPDTVKRRIAAYDAAVKAGHPEPGAPRGRWQLGAIEVAAVALGCNQTGIRYALKLREFIEQDEPKPEAVKPVRPLSPQASYVHGPSVEYVSRPDGTYFFGAIGDTHLGSKYERLDVLGDLYDRFAAAKVDRVFHTGNWIDGEARFNVHDIHTHGMDAQCKYLAKHYPQRPGIVTYAVAGDDHEGWYAQREGVDIGRYAQDVMERSGRQDWKDLGYMEAHVTLRHAVTGATSILAVVHPGGGSAYADSYTVQKIIESLDGGEKPGVALYGHYHKLMAGEYRNVWWVQTGTTQDQTPFARKKRLRFVVGGSLVRLEQDAETGAIVSMTPQLIRYFNRGYYNSRWSHSGGVESPKRSV